MSRASRAPLPAPSLGCSHGYPRLVDEAGNLIRAAIRRELGNRHKGPGAAAFSHTLALLFAKARLQRRWAQADSAERAKDRERAAAARTGQEAEAAEIA